MREVFFFFFFLPFQERTINGYGPTLSGHKPSGMVAKQSLAL